MPVSVDLRGEQVNILIRQGVGTCTFALEFSDITSGLAIDVSAYSWSGGVYAVADRSLVTSWAVDTTDAATGVVRFAVDAAHTAPLATVSEPEVAAYTHTLLVTDDQGGKYTPIFGDFRVIWGTGA